MFWVGGYASGYQGLAANQIRWLKLQLMVGKFLADVEGTDTPFPFSRPHEATLTSLFTL